MKSNTVKHMIKDPSGKRLSRVFVEGKGWFSWNTVFHVYNSTTNYEQMKTGDVPNIKFTTNAFTNPTNPRPDMVKMIHGRKGESTEFVEYRPYNHYMRYAAQKSGDWFFVFEIEPGRGGSVRTLASFPNADSAAHQAFDMALNKAQS